MNPYDFVRVDWNAGVQRGPAKLHHRFEGLSGRIEGEIKTLTPLFIPESKSTDFRVQYKDFITNSQNNPIIPGTSLKGLIRSLVETVGPGCWWLRGKSHSGKLLHDFHQCKDIKNLCVACRMFGLVNSGTLLLGHVGFEDAVCTNPKPHNEIYTIILSSPKDRHTAFYLDENQNHLAGRKFYYHHQSIKTVGNWLPNPNVSPDKRQNQYIKPIDKGSIFTFTAYFNNLSQAELQLLLYALVLESSIRHKIGQAKPAGLGSVEISLTKLEKIDYNQRYRSANKGKTVYEKAELDNYVKQAIQPYTDNHISVTLNDLRDIWAWPGRDDLAYPTQKDFQKHPQATIEEMHQLTHL